MGCDFKGGQGGLSLDIEGDIFGGPTKALTAIGNRIEDQIKVAANVGVTLTGNTTFLSEAILRSPVANYLSNETIAVGNVGMLHPGSIGDITTAMLFTAPVATFPLNAKGESHFIHLPGNDSNTITVDVATAPNAAANMPLPKSSLWPFAVRGVWCQITANDPGFDMAVFCEMSDFSFFIRTLDQLSGGGGQGHDILIVHVFVPVNNYLADGTAQIRLYKELDDVNTTVLFTGYLVN